MARLSLLLLPLLGLLGATIAFQIGKEKIEQIRSIRESPLVETLGEAFGLQLPDVPEINIESKDININELAQNISGTGCLPEGVQFSDNLKQVVQECSLEATEQAETLARRQGGNRRGSRRRGNTDGEGRKAGRVNKRKGNRQDRPNRRGRPTRSTNGRRKRAIMEQFVKAAQNCTVSRLGLQDDDNGLDLEAVSRLIDTEITADDDFKEQKKALAELCITTITEPLNNKTKQELQVQCIMELGKLECFLAVSDSVSESLGVLLRMKKGICLSKGLQLPASAVKAKMICTFEEMLSALGGQEETEPDISTGRRRRRDVDMMAMMGMEDIEELEKMFEEGPNPKQCRRNPKKCRSKFLASKISPAELDEKLKRVESVLGPLDEAFAGLPERLTNIATCWHEAMNSLNDDGSVNAEVLRTMVAETTGAPEAKDAATTIITTCEDMGMADSVATFSACLNEGTAYACTLHKVMGGDAPEMTVTG